MRVLAAFNAPHALAHHGGGAPTKQGSALRLSHARLFMTPQSWAAPPRRAAPALRPPRAVETVEFSADDEADTYYDEYTGHRREGGGYTPFEFVSFSDISLRHELVVRVDAPAAKCYAIWADRFNWMQWFDMIEEVGFHEEDPNLVSMYLWYRWTTTPFLELFVTLERTEAVENKHILEEPVGGMPLVAAVLFEEEGPGATNVKFRLSYQLPDVLQDFAGKLAIWSDVNRKLQTSMERMKVFVEGVDMAELQAAREEDWRMVQEGFPRQRQMREEMAREEDVRVEALRQRMAQEKAEALGLDVDQDKAAAAPEGLQGAGGAEEALAGQGGAAAAAGAVAAEPAAEAGWRRDPASAGGPAAVPAAAAAQGGADAAAAEALASGSDEEWAESAPPEMGAKPARKGGKGSKAKAEGEQAEGEKKARRGRRKKDAE